MNDNSPFLDTLSSIWPDYRSNLPRTLGRLTAVIERRTMAALCDAGFDKLNMSLGSPMTLLSVKPRRLTELAERMGVSKQLCLQSLKPLEAGAYIQRSPDPEDGRAKILSISRRGEELVKAALKELIAIDDQLAKIVGDDAFAHMVDSFQTLSSSPGKAVNAMEKAGAAALIGDLTRRIQKQLMRAAIESGFDDLQPSFAHVLENIDLAGTSISDIAHHEGISLPAVSRITQTLEQRGLIKRLGDDTDKRRRKIFFTARGLELIVDSINHTNNIERQLAEQLGAKPYKALLQTLKTMETELCPETLVTAYNQQTASLLLQGHSPEKALARDHSSKLEALLAYARELDKNPLLSGAPLTQELPDGRVVFRASMLNL